ncbi:MULTISPECIES: hypothetical protein [unclassified Pseudoalteromonas]|uniref:hypothetical protein n=1 Tax=unclassified Pseudoalteromonas TaxID=194690 RepID=UPI000CF6CAE4|nr:MULTISPECIES: hypothetical protein [unclassified Pseudoalteromonas]MBS3796146.1 hypothetical protein [Pseudoalteromonas sp. BDTF-M6]
MTPEKEAESLTNEELLTQLRELDLESDLYLIYYDELRRRNVIEDGKGSIYWFFVLFPAIPIFGLYFDLFRFGEERVIPKEIANIWLISMLFLWGVGTVKYTFDINLYEKYEKENSKNKP